MPTDYAELPQFQTTVGVYGYAPEGVIIRDDFFRDFPEQTKALIEDVRNYWKDNVEKYFSKSLQYPIHVSHHRMKDAVRIETTFKGGTSNGALHVDMAPLVDKGFDFTKSVVEGREPSKYSMYIPELGVSLRVDESEFVSYDRALSMNFGRTTRGTDNMAWKIWVKVFNNYVRVRMKLFVRDCIRAGVVRVVKK